LSHYSLNKEIIVHKNIHSIKGKICQGMIILSVLAVFFAVTFSTPASAVIRTGDIISYHLEIEDIAVPQEWHATTTIALLHDQGAREEVWLFTSDLPQGIAIDFEPRICAPPCVSIARVQADQTARIGIYDIPIYGLNMISEELALEETIMHIIVDPAVLTLERCGPSNRLPSPEDAVYWIAEVRGQGKHRIVWSGHDEVNGRLANPLRVFYGDAGTREAEVRVSASDGQDTGIQNCGSLRVVGAIKEFASDATSTLVIGASALLSWDTTGFTSCNISSDKDTTLKQVPTSCKNADECTDDTRRVSPTISTVYTLSCLNADHGDTDTRELTIHAAEISKL
jgi:hypothetical protein